MQFSLSPPLQKISPLVDHLERNPGHIRSIQLNTQSNLFLLQNLIVTHSGKGQSPAALLLVTPASFRYNHLENPTKAVYMPGNGTFKWLPHATWAAQPTATQHSIRRLSPGVRKPYLYMLQSGLFCLVFWKQWQSRRGDVMKAQPIKWKITPNTYWNPI